MQALDVSKTTSASGKNREIIEETLFDNVKNIDADEDFWFKLRGNSINVLIDVGEPLLGLVCRVKSLSQYDQLDELYQQVVDEIRMIDNELAGLGYEKAVMLSYRYVLCTFIDEAIMGTRWGSGVWTQHSLLTRFHNETWGGEKVYSILSRIESDPKRYRELLEFIYLCFCLGFGGRHRVGQNQENSEKMQQIIGDLQELISINSQEVPDGPLALAPTHNVLKTKNSLNRSVPLWTVFCLFALGLTGVFSYFYISLAQRSESVLDKLNHILS
jgi:type VI secretion system protein ImpK